MAAIEEATLDKVRALMRDVKVPQTFDKVFKDECMFSFDTPFSEAGLCINLKSWFAFGADMVDLDIQRGSGAGGLYLVQKFTRVLKEKPADEPAEAPTKVALGTPDGFALPDDKYDTIKEHSLLVVEPGGTRTSIPLPCADLPTIVIQACDAIIAHKGQKSVDETSRWENDEPLPVSKYYKDLVQLPATRKISPNPKDWKCEKYGATDNLWLNLSDGYIGGGRRFWDGTGGSNGALEHYEEELTKGNNYPLVVKLGTITPKGADVYSYAKDQDDMVENPLLADHLAHWGIDVMKMEKTEKTLAEMEVDLNQNFNFNAITEDGADLKRLRGPGLVGLKNLGNSCYMNSTVQLLQTLPEIKARYADPDMVIRRQSPSDPAADLICQVAKLTSGITSDRYAPPLKEDDDEDDPKLVVAPQMFRTLVGKGHSEFSSNRQQDASEFLQYYLDILGRAERTALGSRLEAGKSSASLFEFAVEERIEQATEAKGVKYSRLKMSELGLPVKLEDAENLAEVTAFKAAQASADEKEAKKPKTEGEPEAPIPIIQVKSCLERLAAPEEGIEFRGASATKTVRLATMPRYLLVTVQRYYLDEKWCPAKLECKVPMPAELSLEHLRGKGVQPGETELADDAGPAAAGVPAAPALEPDETIFAQLLSMGLPENASKRACVGVMNSSAEAAAGWYFEHMGDADINDPLPTGGDGGGGGGGAAAPVEVDPEALMMLSAMGFEDKYVRGALKACDNNVERAATWLLSHEDLEAAVAALDAPSGGGGAADAGPAVTDYDDGVGEYKLLGFISHIGKNTACGHYVCHMRRGPDDSWVLFNDQKVAQSKAPPLDFGYIYLYRRKDAA